MPRVLRYLSHPQVQINPDIAVTDWGLSALGRNRLMQIDFGKTLSETQTIISSNEVKAVETATIICDGLGVLFARCDAMHENDRSATGFLPPEEFEQIADQFFAHPTQSVRGWETAAAAQERIVAEAKRVIDTADHGDILLVGHGAVGTLLYCHFAKLPIDRRHDQPNGGGNFFSVDLKTLIPLHGWKPLEHI